MLLEIISTGRVSCCRENIFATQEGRHLRIPEEKEILNMTEMVL